MESDLTSFTYHRATRLSDALAHLGRAGACAYAGGTDLLVGLRHRAEWVAGVRHLVDIKDIHDARGIELDGDMLRIGALSTTRETRVEFDGPPNGARAGHGGIANIRAVAACERHCWRQRDDAASSRRRGHCPPRARCDRRIRHARPARNRAPSDRRGDVTRRTTTSWLAVTRASCAPGGSQLV